MEALRDILFKSFKKVNPELTTIAIHRKVAQEEYKRTGKFDRDVIHFQLPNTFNVRCFNGSAHANRTRNIEMVTCPLCL